MIKKFFSATFPYLFFFIITCILFRPYLLHNQVPFPGNLLVSFYQPYASYSWKGYPGGVPNKQVGFDDLRIYYPIRTFTNDALQHFTLPLWNPYYFSGNVGIGTYQSVVFFPLGFLYFILPQIDAWSVILFLAPFLAMVFMYLFLQATFVNKKASMLGAMGFGLCGYILANTEDIYMAVYAAMFLPVILLGVKKIYEKISVGGFLCIVGGTIGTILSGWFQVTLYILALALIYSIYTACFSKERIKKVLLIFSAFLLGIALCSFQIFPTIEAYSYSARNGIDVKNLFDVYLVPWYHLVTYVAPDFFGNPGTYNYFGGGSYSEKVLFVAIPVLVFALYGIFIAMKKKFHHEVYFYAIAWISSLVLGFSNPVSWFLLYSLHLPLVSTMLPSRIFIISAFCVCWLSAYGLVEFEKKRLWLPMTVAWILVGILLGTGWMFVILVHKIPFIQHIFGPDLVLSKRLANIATAKRNLLLPSFFYLLTIFAIALSLLKRFRKNSFILCIVIVAVSGIYFANKYLFFSDRQFTFPQVPVLVALQQIVGNNRVWSFGTAHLERNFLVQYHLQSPEGYDALSSGRYAELLYAAGTYGVLTSTEILRANAVIPDAKNATDIFNNPLRVKLLSLLGVQYIIGPNSAGLQNLPELIPVWHDGKFVIYRFSNAYPRAFFVDNVVTKKSKQAILTALFSPKIDLRKTAIVEDNLHLAESAVQVSATATITRYTPNAVTIKTQTNKQAVLFLSDNYYPGWHAFIDEKETTIYRADYSFRSVIVPKGNHVVNFVYNPLSFTLGVIVSIFSFTAIVFIGVLLKIKNSKK